MNIRVIKKWVILLLILCGGSVWPQIGRTADIIVANKADLVQVMKEDKDMASEKAENMKRAAPKAVNSVTFNGVRYEAFHGGRARGLSQNGGFIIATDVATNKELQVIKIYSIEYDPNEETDVQDIYIKNIQLYDDKRFLKITDERNRNFLLDLKTREVAVE
jgi:hypothetical protein